MRKTRRLSNLLIAVLFLLTTASSAAQQEKGVEAANLGVNPGFKASLQEPDGFRISGYVRLESGQGVPNVAIYQVLAMYWPGALVASSGPDGFYQADFTEIPSIETITVHAERACYTFLPEWETWMHYGGRYEKTINFTAYPAACSHHYLPFS